MSQNPSDDNEVVVGPIRDESVEYLDKMGDRNTAAAWMKQIRTNHPSVPPSVPLLPSQGGSGS